MALRIVAARLATCLAMAWAGAGCMAALDEPLETTIRHALWDANQRPLYQRCANDFERAHPGVRIRFQQLGWDDYWTGLATGFVSGTAPDVFTNHLMRYPDYVLNGVMTDLTPRISRERVDTGIYERGLLEMWQHESRQYALPTDWDAMAILVNVAHVKAAGLRLEDLHRLDWNPRDGGSFGRMIERLTVDEQGHRAGDPGFDRRRVRVWGYMTPGHGGMFGQSEWSHLVASTGWRYQDRPWDPALHYDDPRFVETMRWLATLPVKGLSPSRNEVGQIPADALFMNGRIAMLPSGSWMVGHYQRLARIEVAWVPLPVGPSGKSTSMVNSLGLSIWSGSPHQDAAWQWVKHVGSRECQARIAEMGVVYPAVRGLGQVSVEAQRRRGADVQVYVDAARGETFLPPIVVRTAEINDLMGTTLEAVLYGGADAAPALAEATRRIHEITRTP